MVGIMWSLEPCGSAWLQFDRHLKMDMSRITRAYGKWVYESGVQFRGQSNELFLECIQSFATRTEKTPWCPAMRCINRCLGSAEFVEFGLGMERADSRRSHGWSVVFKFFTWWSLPCIFVERPHSHYLGGVSSDLCGLNLWCWRSMMVVFIWEHCIFDSASMV